jgi:hypothetical protein
MTHDDRPFPLAPFLISLAMGLVLAWLYFAWW